MGGYAFQRNVVGIVGDGALTDDTDDQEAQSTRGSNGNDAKARTAFHEAGHVVAHLAFGIPFAYVTIVESQDNLGHLMQTDGKLAELGSKVCEKFEELENDDRIYLEHHIMSLFAGGIAESAHSNEGASGTREDSNEIVSIAEVANGTWDWYTLNPYIEWLFRRTVDWITGYDIWLSVSLIASALIESESLTSDEVRQIVKDARGKFSIVNVAEIDEMRQSFRREADEYEEMELE